MTFNEIQGNPSVHVGIMDARVVRFVLNGAFEVRGRSVAGEQVVEWADGGVLWQGERYDGLLFEPQGDGSTFTLCDVTIGKTYHWERHEAQTFGGQLKFVANADRLEAVNVVAVEDYLVSVISSEMKSTASLEFLKAAAVISRSWLLAQIERRTSDKADHSIGLNGRESADEIIRWTESEAHTLFDVCADDHCQRYQGLTRVVNENARRAVEATRGLVLTSGGELCDARFSKCCGGVTEEFHTCWCDKDFPYLPALRDTPDGADADLSDEVAARQWIMSSPDAFCHTDDVAVLSQVLNDYDCETRDFYRWRVVYTQDELQALITKKLGMNFGDILDLVPVERGKSGRLSRLRIVGSRRTLTVGKELEIRRALSESHLYSSAFVVDREDFEGDVPRRFVLTGAGWGHGVGLCQIGAAVMGAKGYTYEQILLHYYRGAVLERLY
jgi:SpoIID/LytB domain protein